MKKRIALGIVIFSLVLTGCAKEQIYRSNPPIKIVGNEFYEVTLQPRMAEGYNYFNSFLFVFVNKTDEDLIIDWLETYFLHNGKRHGRFGWEGLTFAGLKEIQDQPKITIVAGRNDSTLIFRKAISKSKKIVAMPKTLKGISINHPIFLYLLGNKKRVFII